MMVDRKPTAYCSVCGKHVVLNIHGTITQHITGGKTCPGSELGGDVDPKE